MDDGEETDHIGEAEPQIFNADLTAVFVYVILSLQAEGAINGGQNGVEDAEVAHGEEEEDIHQVDALGDDGNRGLLNVVLAITVDEPGIRLDGSNFVNNATLDVDLEQGLHQPLTLVHQNEQEAATAINSQEFSSIVKDDIFSVISEATLVLVLYFMVSTSSVIWMDTGYDGLVGRTNSTLINGLYYSTSSITSIGYGDICPTDTGPKIVASVLVLLGTGYGYRFIDAVAEYVITLYENQGKSIEKSIQLTATCRVIISKTRMIVTIAIVCFLVQVIFAIFLEGFGILDSIYFTLISSSTIGYGDYSFTKPQSRLCAWVLMLIAPIVFGRLFELLVKWRLGARRRAIDEWILLHDNEETKWWLSNSDREHENGVKETFFKIYKLKSLKKITDEDLEDIHNVFLDMEAASQQSGGIQEISGGTA